MNAFVDPFRHVRERVLAVIDELASENRLPTGLDTRRVVAEPPRDRSHGDVATNAALVLASAAHLKPRAMAEMLVERVGAGDSVASAEVAGPGFLNLRMKESFWHARLAEIIAAGRSFGDSNLGAGEPINVEYVSANPTGPLHVGHGRGAVVGDALASLLEKAGYDVTREYYINDAGGQVDSLAHSVRLRYLIALGEEPAEAFESARAEGRVEYGGEYLIPVAEALAERDGNRWVDVSIEEWLPALRAFAVERLMEGICEDLDAVGIRFQVMTSERGLVEKGRVEEVVNFLTERDLIYDGVLDPPKGKILDDWEPRPQTLFRATRFGDEVDRPLMKSDGAWTYFAADMAYHLDKFRRGFPTMIDVWGADHGGYVRRMQAAVSALTEGAGSLDVKLCQLVNLLDGGEPVKMSKRAGTFVTLREVVDRVGRDVFRFIMLTRRNDASLDFDFQTVTEQSKDNPVFYVQYAHARCCSVMRHATEELGSESIADERLIAADFAQLSDPAELDLIKAMANWPQTIEGAAQAHEPHRIAFFLQDIASLFHGLWTKGKEEARLRFIHPDDKALTLARLGLVRAVQSVLATGLGVIGVQPVEELR